MKQTIIKALKARVKDSKSKVFNNLAFDVSFLLDGWDVKNIYTYKETNNV